MANIEEQVYEKIKNIAKSSVTTGLQTGISAATMILNFLIARRKEELKGKTNDEIDKELSPLNEMLDVLQKNKDELNTFTVKADTYNTVKEMLDKTGVKYATAENTVTGDVSIYYLNSESDKVRKILEMINVKEGLLNEMRPDMFIEYIEDKEMGTLSNITAYELELFRHYVGETDAVFSVVKVADDNNFTLMFDEKDKIKILNIIQKADWDLSSEHGDLIKERIDYKLSGRTEINIAIRDAEREFVIASATNPSEYIHVTDKDYTVYKNNKSYLNKRDDSMIEDLTLRIDSIANPVIMTKDDFDALNEEKRNELGEKTQMFPNHYSNAGLHIIRDQMNDFVHEAKEKEQKTYEKINQNAHDRSIKYALDNEGDAVMYLDDSSISYSNFSQFEAINDMDSSIKEADLAHFIRTNRMVNSHEYSTTSAEPTLDDTIKKFEAQQKTRNSDYTSRQKNKEDRDY